MIRDALVVGINTYQDDTLPNLKAPASEAEAIDRANSQTLWRISSRAIA